MPSIPTLHSKARSELARISHTESDGRFVRLDFESPLLRERSLAGQFFEVICHLPEAFGPSRASLTSPLLNRPFSLHRWLPGGFSILFEIVGPGTRWLGTMRAGDRLRVIGPLGRGVQGLPEWIGRLVLVAGGMGIAAFTAFAQLSQKQRVPTWLYYGVNTETDLPLGGSGGERENCPILGELKELGCQITLASMLDRSFFPGTVIDLVGRDWMERRGPFDVPPDQLLLIACGPPSMLKAMALFSAEHRLNCYLLLEEIMGCGVGICRSCVVPGIDRTANGRVIKHNLAVCRDGPIVRADRIDWETDWS